MITTNGSYISLNHLKPNFEAHLENADCRPNSPHQNAQQIPEKIQVVTIAKII